MDKRPSSSYLNYWGLGNRKKATLDVHVTPSMKQVLLHEGDRKWTPNNCSAPCLNLQSDPSEYENRQRAKTKWKWLIPLFLNYLNQFLLNDLKPTRADSEL